jgi:hypothetical protein
MSHALAAPVRAPVDVCSLTLLFFASASVVCGGSLGIAGGQALSLIDQAINRAAPTLADEVVEAPLEVHQQTAMAERVQPFVLPFGDKIQRERALNCLTEAVYYEAGYQPLAGQQAVAQVVLNRVRDRNFPSTVCGVVYQGWKRRTGCQFSFACDGSRRRRPPTLREWDRAELVAERAVSGFVMAEVGTATHYHTVTTRPWWESTVVKVAEVGDHVFYRWPGRAGQVAALDADRWSGHEPALASPPKPREAVTMEASRRG